MKITSSIDKNFSKKTKKNLLYYFVIPLLWILICRKIYFAYWEFDVDNVYFVGDFLHFLTHVKFFVTGEDYTSWTTPPGSYDSNYLPVFPGLTLFFLPLVYMNIWVAKAIAVAINIIFPYVTTYPICRSLHIPYTWKFWQFSKENMTTLFIFMMFYYTRPYTDVACHAGQLNAIVVFLTYFSLFSLQGSYLGWASGLKFSLALQFFPVLLVLKKYKEVLKGMLILAFIMIFPIIFYHDIWNLYLSYFLKAKQHLNEVNHDTLAGCAYEGGCIRLLELAWFKDNVYNLIVKGFLAVFLCYGYWKIWKLERFGLYSLLLIGSTTLLICYHRTYDEQLIIIPLLMCLIAIYKEKNWKMAICPALIYFCYLIPTRMWLHISSVLGSYFIDTDWFAFRLFPTHPILPLDSVVTLFIVLLAFKRLWCEQDIYLSCESTSSHITAIPGKNLTTEIDKKKTHRKDMKMT